MQVLFLQCLLISAPSQRRENKRHQLVSFLFVMNTCTLFHRQLLVLSSVFDLITVSGLIIHQQVSFKTHTIFITGKEVRAAAGFRQGETSSKSLCQLGLLRDISIYMYTFIKTHTHKNKQTNNAVMITAPVETFLFKLSHSPVLSSWHVGGNGELLLTAVPSFFSVFRHLSSLLMHSVTSSRVMPTAEAALR